MVSLIMSSSRIHYLRVMEVNKEMMSYITLIGWWLVIPMVVTLVGMYGWYWVKSRKDKKVRLGDEAGNRSVHNGRYCKY